MSDLDIDTIFGDQLVNDHVDEFALLESPRILFHIDACRWSHEFKVGGPRVMKAAMLRHLRNDHELG